MQRQGHVLTGRTSQGLDDVHTPGLLEASGYPHSLILAQRPSFPLPSHHAGFPAPAGEGSPRPRAGPRPQTPGPRIFWFLLYSHREGTSVSPEQGLEPVSYPLVEAGSGATNAVKEEAPCLSRLREGPRLRAPHKQPLAFIGLHHDLEAVRSVASISVENILIFQNCKTRDN